MKTVRIILSVCIACICASGFAQTDNYVGAYLGDADDQYNLALCYKNGDGVDQDYTEALFWFYKAAEQGHILAEHNLGIFFFYGIGVNQDYDRAYYWWRKAAEQGYSQSQYNLGLCYEILEGLDNSNANAAYWYREAAKQGDSDAKIAFVDLIGNLKEEEITALNSLGIHSHNGFKYVDLGLSVKWATCNVGAAKPEDYGSYFAWGETSPKSKYDWTNLKYLKKGNKFKNVKFSKYVAGNRFGRIDGRTVLDLTDDAANANWGGGWRLPSENEFQELIDNCIWTWISLNGNCGYLVMSKLNGNCIFIPAGGEYFNLTILAKYRVGNYMSRSLDEIYSCDASALRFDAEKRITRGIYRHYGFSARPVIK